MSEIQVTYGVKELLALHNDKLDRIERKVDEGNLQTAQAIAGIEHRVTVLEQRPDLEPRVRQVESAQAALEGVGRFRRWILPTVASIVSAAAMAVAVLLH